MVQCTQELGILLITAVSIGFFHTLFGPDHYVPFIVMAKARQWSAFKTTWITIVCGIGHVGSSIILGFVGIAFGIAVAHLEPIESMRGNIAGWSLIAFGPEITSWFSSYHDIFRHRRGKQRNTRSGLPQCPCCHPGP